MSNPYNDIISIIRNQGSHSNPVPFLLGKVKSVSPLLIIVDGQQFTRANFKINKLLISLENELLLNIGDDVKILTNFQTHILDCVVI